MGFRIKYICVALIGVFTARTVLADTCQCGWETCSTTEYCVVNQVWDPDAQMLEDVYSCERCPVGQAHDDTCFACTAACAGYDAPCPAGTPTGLKCKKVGSCPAPCQKYEICNPVNSNIETHMLGACHEEDNNCYANETDCSSFEISVDYGAWSCDTASQTGRATWDGNAWDTSLCRCSVTNKDIDMDIANTLVKCKKANAEYFISSAHSHSTTRLTDSIHYTVERQYCTKCYPGYLPYVETSPLDGLIIAPAGVNSAYGVRVCKNMVSKPYYTPGCDINYPLNNPGSNMCREDCPDNMETVENGATSENDCLPRGVLYEDATGFFKLGTDSNLCN
ncbi:MAG: hypothetical protein J5620_04395 [Alphaproteobacteria bacterium]|nr:hypothetical protein [Alphaproteobacteria bacterium]